MILIYQLLHDFPRTVQLIQVIPEHVFLTELLQKCLSFP
jgi:hypothetical protein